MLAFTLTDVTAASLDAAEQLTAFVSGYRADPSLRAALADAITQRAGTMYELLRSSHLSGVEPWGSMYTNGHGEHWHQVLRYVEQHHDIWNQALTRTAHQ